MTIEHRHHYDVRCTTETEYALCLGCMNWVRQRVQPSDKPSAEFMRLYNEYQSFGTPRWDSEAGKKQTEVFKQLVSLRE